jgi:hypothetical protein
MRDTTLLRLRIAAALASAALTHAASAEDASSVEQSDPEPALHMVEVDPAAALQTLQGDIAALNPATTSNLCVPYSTLLASADPDAATNAPLSLPSAGICPVQLPPLVQSSLTQRNRDTMYIGEATLLTTTTDGAPLEADTCCYEVMFTERFIHRPVRGRPLIDDHGDAVVASMSTAPTTSLPNPWLLPRASNLTDTTTLTDLADDARAWLAAQWLQDGLSEHASIASFARASLELMTLGAPPDLLTRVHAAAIDEIDHARRCFSLATAYAGRTLSPGHLPAPSPRALDLPSLAVDTFLEACVGESTATLQATRQRRLATTPDVIDTLDVIIDDEANHAALAWQTLSWAISLGGEPVKAALRAAARSYAPPDTASSPLLNPPASLTPALLAAHGRLTTAADAKAQRDAWDEIILPTLHDLLSP